MKKLLLGAAAVSASISAAKAQINYVDIPDQTLASGEGIYFDFDGGTASSFLTAYSDFRIYFGGGDTVRAETAVYGGVWQVATSVSRAARYVYGASLAFSGLQSSAEFTYGTAGQWVDDPGTDTAFLAVQNATDFRKVWIGVKFSDADNEVTVESFGVAPQSVALKAGEGMAPVPEPAETAAVMALLAGAAAMYRRRQRSS